MTPVQHAEHVLREIVSCAYVVRNFTEQASVKSRATELGGTTMSQIPEVNPADAPVGGAALTVDRPRTMSSASGLVPWMPNGVVMGLTFALLQLMNEVGSLMAVNLYGAMSADLKLTPATVSWSLLATTIASAATLGLLIRLADNYGHKRILVITLITITIGFALSAIAPNFIVLVVGRALVGVTAAPALCIAILSTRLSLPDQKRAIGIITGGLAIAVLVGFALGGIMVQIGASWRTAFGIAAALTVLSMIGLIWVPESDIALRTKSRLDIVGVTLLGVGLTAFCIGFSEISSWGWNSVAAWGLIVGGAVLGLLWVAWESRYPDPIADPRLLLSRKIYPAIGTFAVIGFTAFFLYSLVATYAQTVPSIAHYGFGLTPLLAGLVLLPVTVGGLITSRTTPPLLLRYGPRVPLVLGSIVFSLGFLWLWLFHAEIWEYEVGIMLFGLSVTTTITTSLSILAAEAPKDRPASLSGLYLVISTVMVSIGTAAYAAIQGTGVRPGSPFVTVGTYDLSYLVIFLVSLVGIVLAVLLPRSSRVAIGSGMH
jgi:MFS family permease